MLLNMMVSSDQELKISRMCKRSQRKNIFSRDCYKLKEFVLTPTLLKYFEISGGVNIVYELINFLVIEIIESWKREMHIIIKFS